MSHIFISYASADRDRAKTFADILIAQGWSVWWDRIIPPGREFDEVIEEALDAASCVVVLWSKHSVASRWVKTESAEAMRRKVLVPALIDDAKIPLEFRRLQAADLSQWHGEPDHPELQNFFQSLESHASRAQKAVPAASAINLHASAPSAQARPVTALPPSAPAAGNAQPSRQGMSMPAMIAVGALLAIVMGVTGYNVYRAQDVAKAQERLAAEQQRVANEAARQAQEKRRVADDTVAQVKAAREDALRESARRKTADEAAAMVARGRAAPVDQSRQSQVVQSPDPGTAPPAADALPGVINISGMWRDATGGVHQIRQTGNRFEIVSTNPSNGYYSQSSGTINGKQISTNFQSNLPSTGYARGIIAADGRSISGTVIDSRQGQYGLTIYR